MIAATLSERGVVTDARVTIHQGDVGDLIRPNRSTFDAILLDVDNGPQGLVREANDSLYSAQGLNAAHAALRPGGVLAVRIGPKRTVYAGLAFEGQCDMVAGAAGGNFGDGTEVNATGTWPCKDKPALTPATLTATADTADTADAV